MDKKLYELTLNEYNILKSFGRLYEFYPEATGNIDEDLQAVEVCSFINNYGKIVKQYDIIDV